MNPNGRIYETEQQASNAFQGLVARGFGEKDLHMAGPSFEGAVVDANSFMQRDVIGGELPAFQAQAYAAAVNHGHYVVIAAPAFGFGGVADGIMDSFNPVNPGGFPYVKADNPSPLSDLFNIPLLSDPRRRITMWARMFSPLTKPGFAMSSMLGMGLLSKNGTPLSSMMGLKPLSGNDRPWKSSMGLPLLSKSATPFSSMFGLKLLTKG